MLIGGVVQLQGFSLEQAMKRPIVRDRSQVVHEESLAVVLDGDSPQRVVSADGYDVIYRIPGACRGKALVRASLHGSGPPLMLSSGIRVESLQ